MKSSLYVKNKSILSLLEEQHADKQNAYAHAAAEKIFPQSGESAVYYKPSEHLNIMIKRIETDYVLHHFGHRLKGVEYRRKVQPHCEQNAVKVLDIPEKYVYCRENKSQSRGEHEHIHHRQPEEQHSPPQWQMSAEHNDYQRQQREEHIHQRRNGA